MFKQPNFYHLIQSVDAMYVAAKDPKGRLLVTAGTCAHVTPKGIQTRTDVRDWIPMHLKHIAEAIDLNIYHVEVQVGQESHGREYVYEVDGVIEKKARELADVRLYVITSDTLSGVTFEEILFDLASGRRNIIVYFIGMEPGKAQKFYPEGFEPRIYDSEILVGLNQLQSTQMKLFWSGGKSLRENFFDMYEAYRMKFGSKIRFCYNENDVKRELVRALTTKKNIFTRARNIIREIAIRYL